MGAKLDRFTDRVDNGLAAWSDFPWDKIGLVLKGILFAPIALFLIITCWPVGYYLEKKQERVDGVQTVKD